MSSPLLTGILRAAQGGTGQGVPTAGSLLYGDGSGWSKLAAAAGKVLISGASAPAWQYRLHRVTWVAYPAAQATWTNMPAAEAFYMASDRTITMTDLDGGYTQCRLLVMKSSVAGAVGSKLYLKYKAGVFSSNVANYSAIGASSVEVAIDVANTHLKSAWIDLAAGAKAADIHLAITGDGGDGVLDPQFGIMAAEFR